MLRSAEEGDEYQCQCDNNDQYIVNCPSDRSKIILKVQYIVRVCTNLDDYWFLIVNVFFITAIQLVIIVERMHINTVLHFVKWWCIIQ